MKRIRTVSVSGGKDSTATYLWAMDKYGPGGFLAVFADTGNEHPVTVNYIKNLHLMTGGPKVHIVRADVSRYTPEIKNPFLSLAVKKRRFPSVRARFCRQHLKEIPIQRWVAEIRGDSGVTMLTGLRRAESRHRYLYPRRMYDRHYDCLHLRPIISWSEEQVFAFIRAHGIEPNPLYAEGLRRVGCWPCVCAGKIELSRLSDGDVSRIREWEQKVTGGAGRKNCPSSFFPWRIDPTRPEPTIDDVVAWARTTRGGRQNDLFAGHPTEVPACMGDWTICE